MSAEQAMDAAPGLGPVRLLVPPVQLTALAVWSVVTERDVPCYGRAVEFLEAVNRSVPNLVASRHFHRLVLGLKAKIILEMFVEDSSPSDIQAALSLFFPEDAPAERLTVTRDMEKVSQVQRQFRELVLNLLSNPAFRTSFLQGPMREEYGEEFMSVLQKLLWEYLQRLDQSLPKVMFDQLREAAQAADSSDPRHAQFLIGCLKKLDPRSLWLLVPNTEASDPQDRVSLGLASEVEPDSNLRGGPTFPTAWRSAGPRPPGEDGLSPRAPAGREEGGEGSGRVSAPFTPEQRAAGSRQPWARGPERRRSGRASRGGAGAPGRSCGGDPGCPPPRQSEPGDAGLQHAPPPFLLLQPAAPVETSSARREVKGPPPPSPSPACGRCGRISARKRAASGEGGSNGESSPGPGEPTRPWRLTGIKQASGREVHGTRRDSDRSPWEGSSPSTSPSRRWRLPRRSKEKENQAASGLIHPVCRSPDVGGSRERLQDPTTGIVPLRPHSVELTDVISDSEDEGRDPLTACLGGKGPLRLYQRTKYDTYIPTLVQHLRPLAVHPCYVALERLARPTVS